MCARVRVQTLVANVKRASITRRILRLNENIYISLGPLIHLRGWRKRENEWEAKRMSEYDWNSEHTEVAVNLVLLSLFLAVCRPITDFLITLILCRVHTTALQCTYTRENIVI